MNQIGLSQEDGPFYNLRRSIETARLSPSPPARSHLRVQQTTREQWRPIYDKLPFLYSHDFKMTLASHVVERDQYVVSIASR